MINVNLGGIAKFLPQSELLSVAEEVENARLKLLAGTGAGSDFLGWRDLPEKYDREEFARIKAAAEKIKKDAEVLLVIGIGGSYLGARAALEFVKSGFYNLKKKDTPDILFVGNNLSSDYARDVLDIIEGRDFAINVISKSGTTTEPAVAFRVFKKALEDKYGKSGADSRIYATTDRARGTLKKQADDNGWQSFVVPDDIGGRFSVLTAVGLLPLAAAGLDIDALMDGAKEAAQTCSESGPDNPAIAYAAARNALYRKGYRIEVLASYEPNFRFFAEWWKQLYGESEGKRGLGIFPASVDLTADLHSMGQYLQDGERTIQETVVTFAEPLRGIDIELAANDGDGLNFLAGKSLHYVNSQAYRGTYLAHIDGGVPNIEIAAQKPDERTLGQLICFFEFACALSGYTLGVNPFDQPGVEAYKKNMFALLGKPGYEELREQLTMNN